MLSIKQIFFNLKGVLLILGLGAFLLILQLISISQYSQRLEALKNQHTLIDKIISTDLKDIEMATIIINGHLSELALSVKLSASDALFDPFIASEREQSILSNSLITASSAFQDTSLFWLESIPHAREKMHHQMISARNVYLVAIDRVIDYQIQLINQSISIAKTTVMILFLLGLITFLLYRFRLNQIYRDINKACSLDTNGRKPIMETQEIDFIVKRLARKTPTSNTSPSLFHPLSGLTNEKGMVSIYNTNRSNKNSNSFFIALFEIDQHSTLINTLSKEEMAALYKKMGEIIAMYEQPLDLIAHLDDHHFVFVMARNSKDIALSDAEKIVHSIYDSAFSTAQGSIKITLSGGFLLMPPKKSLDESIANALKILAKAKDRGGNCVAQLR
ncbi:MAG: diguanylate cyclase [Sulfuricurvum sp.]|nr:diguanylate cyclase [Sulfuricurvum sp.]